MKKTVTLPDGTIEVLEGTPEEIAEHENLIRVPQKPKEKSGPEVLKGSGEKSMEQLLKDWIEKQLVYVPQGWEYTPHPAELQRLPETKYYLLKCPACFTSPCTCLLYKFYTTSDHTEQ